MSLRTAIPIGGEVVAGKIKTKIFDIIRGRPLIIVKTLIVKTTLEKAATPILIVSLSK